MARTGDSRDLSRRPVLKIHKRAASDRRQFVQSRHAGAGRVQQTRGNELPALVIAAMPDVTERGLKCRIQDSSHPLLDLAHVSFPQDTPTLVHPFM